MNPDAIDRPGAGNGGDAPRPTLCLVRHARAGSRQRWAGDDRDRPLTERGYRQTVLLADHILGHLGCPARILSSPAVRCLQTLTPLADKCGLDVIPADWLDEGSSPADAFDRLRSLTLEAGTRGSGGPVAAATHGDVILGILELLVGGGVDLGETVDAPKGGTFTLVFHEEKPPAASFYLPEVTR